MKKLLLLIPLLFIGCHTLNPGADPFVVMVEQAQSGALATFDFIVYMDHANRGFWRTNAPAFHNFAEWLRTPQSYGTSVVPRSVAIQLNVDDMKLAYKASKTAPNSNALWSAWAVLNEAINQSLSWSNIITAPTHP